MRLRRVEMLKLVGELKYSKRFGAIFLILLILSGCATVGVNNYQDAETLGKGKYKAGLALEVGRNMDAGISTNYGNIEFDEDPLSLKDFVFPIVELAGQYGITRSTDIGLALSSTIIFPASGSAVFYVKQNLIHTPGNFAISLMPGSGIFGSDSKNTIRSLTTGAKWEERDKFHGFLLSVPVIISKRWEDFSLYLSPKYIYHHLKVTTDYKDSSGRTINSDKKSFDFNTLGASIGCSSTFKRITITPEVSYLRVQDLTNDSYRWIFFPGLGLCLKF